VILDSQPARFAKGGDHQGDPPVLCEKACVIVFSGAPEPEYREQALEAGANDFFSKGIGADPQPFIDRLTNLLPQCYPRSS
jgi:PleD family two-component response regulator